MVIPVSTEGKISRFIQPYRNKNISTAETLTAISNTYHHFESGIYDAAHPDIWLNKSYLQSVFEKHVVANASTPLRILDMGCGTGFVTEVILEMPLEGKIGAITLFDLSNDMVLKAKEKLAYSSVPLLFLAGENDIKKLQQQSFDVVITNAVLHHIPDISSFCNLISSFIVQGGFYIAGHEPNASYYKNSELQGESNRFRKFKKRQIRLSLSYWLFKLGLRQSMSARPYLDIVKKTNDELLAQGVITSTIPALKLPKLIDIHVPFNDFQEQPWGEPGFDAANFAERFMPAFTVIETDSYSHIKDDRVNDYPQWRKRSEALKNKYPKEGADLIMVLKKKSG